MAVAADVRLDREKRRWRGRLGRLGVLVALLGSLVTLVAPTAANAVTCGNPGGYVVVAGGDQFSTIYKVMWLKSSTQTFNASETRTIFNNLTTPVTGTWTSQVARTFSISAMSGITVTNWTQFFNFTVSTTITSSTTTTIGISATATVPPGGAVKGSYGVKAFNTVSDIDTYRLPRGSSSCIYEGSVRGVQQNVPTAEQGWELHQE
ncbi:MAG TPA: hypothetical protein VMU51_08965 [Mycobacteriales bacterium]|nr:hypothetical protein [Mycobacteriales bacterium]